MSNQQELFFASRLIIFIIHLYLHLYNYFLRIFVHSYISNMDMEVLVLGNGHSDTSSNPGPG